MTICRETKREWRETVDSMRAFASSILTGHMARQREEPTTWEPWEASQCRREVGALKARINKLSLTDHNDYAKQREIKKEADRLQQRYSPPISWVTGPNGDGYE